MGELFKQKLQPFISCWWMLYRYRELYSCFWTVEEAKHFLGWTLTHESETYLGGSMLSVSLWWDLPLCLCVTITCQSSVTILSITQILHLPVRKMFWGHFSNCLPSDHLFPSLLHIKCWEIRFKVYWRKSDHRIIILAWLVNLYDINNNEWLQINIFYWGKKQMALRKNISWALATCWA